MLENFEAEQPSNRFRTEFTTYSLGTEQEGVGGIRATREKNGIDLLAEVAHNGELIVLVTTDMGSGEYTIEFKTAPTEINDLGGWKIRKDAISRLVDLIEARAGSKEACLKTGDLKEHGYTVTAKEKHKFVKTGGPGTISGFANQATFGVPCIDIGTDQMPAALLTKAPWYEADHKHQKITGHPARLYSFVLSVLNYLAMLVEDEKLSMGDLDPSVYKGNLVDSAIKNKWTILPRTAVIATLDVLATGERSAVLAALREAGPPDGVPTDVWKAAREYIFNKGLLAGHDQAIPTINKQTGALFEIRGDIPDIFAHALHGEEMKTQAVQGTPSDPKGNSDRPSLPLSRMHVRRQAEEAEEKEASESESDSEFDGDWSG